jgi:hypothetical protein
MEWWNSKTCEEGTDQPGLFVYDFTPGCHDTSNIYDWNIQYYVVNEDLQATWCTDAECTDCHHNVWPDRNGELAGHYVLDECHPCEDEDSPPELQFHCSFMQIECPPNPETTIGSTDTPVVTDAPGNIFSFHFEFSVITYFSGHFKK